MVRKMGGQYKHKETGIVMLLHSASIDDDFYELSEQYGENGKIVQSWYGNYEQFCGQFEAQASSDGGQ